MVKSIYPMCGLVSSRRHQLEMCLENNGGCWKDQAANATACKDTFRGRVCECHVVQG
ncbi:hypothetical protein MKW98_016829, partial [Papaver atlanticum]